MPNKIYQPYVIKFERSDGSQGEAIQDGRTPAEALRDFKVVYRHGLPKHIISVEPVGPEDEEGALKEAFWEAYSEANEFLANMKGPLKKSDIECLQRRFARCNYILHDLEPYAE